MQAEIITTFIFKRQAQIFAELYCSKTGDEAEEWATKNIKKKELDLDAFREEIGKNIHRYKAGLLYRWQKQRRKPTNKPKDSNDDNDDDKEPA